ncbi:MAG: ribonuclease H family protein [Tannerellaceae bacterium]|jgi:ribonuclease HI|nr:ribonuclease H family protein [Tannerellaceae bacterium]
MPKGKFYVVWKGINPGIYDNWDDCRRQTEGQAGAKYKAFLTRQEAVEAFAKGHQAYLHNTGYSKTVAAWKKPSADSKPIRESIAVDAACSGNPGDMEYRGVYTATGEEIFHMGPFKRGTNNVGEFLALVHALALLKKHGSTLPVYSDSLNAIKWVRNKKSKTLLERSEANRPVFDLLERAERWLSENDYSTTILKWETALWGEIPADFGRK